MPFQEVLQDVGGLGGISLFLIVTVVALFNNISLGFTLSVCLAVLYAVMILIRLVWFRQRPDKQRFSSWLQRIDASSFPSMHTMRASALSIVLGMWFQNTFVFVLLVIVALLVGWTRVHFKRHYWSDVIIGWFLGVILGWFSVWIITILPNL